MSVPTVLWDYGKKNCEKLLKKKEFLIQGTL